MSLLLHIISKFPIEIQKVVSIPSSFVIRQIWNKFNMNYRNINDGPSKHINTNTIISSNLLIDYDFYYKFLIQILMGQGLLHFFAFKSGYLDGFD